MNMLESDRILLATIAILITMTISIVKMVNDKEKKPANADKNGSIQFEHVYLILQQK